MLAEGAHLIGRRTDCAVTIDEPSVSRVHARLDVSRDVLRIQDLRSKNGTFVAGRRIEAATDLLDRCEVRIGEVVVAIARLAPGEASTLTVA